jgi:hypothetical protein
LARHVPSEFAEKAAAVQTAVDSARTQGRRAFEVGTEVTPGVRLVSIQERGIPVVFSLWTWETDVAELCGDAAYPATGGLLAIDRAQLADLSRAGIFVDLSYLTRSESLPGVYYALCDHVSDQQLKAVVGRVVPPGAHTGRG